MGHFLAVSAFRTDDLAGLLAAVTAYCAEHDAAAKPFTGTEPSSSTDAQFYAPVNGWICCLWPSYFNVSDFPLCTDLAKRLNIDVSTVHVYDGDFWEHLFVKAGERIHFFCSCPTYFAPEETESVDSSVPREPVALCAHLGVPEERIVRYLQTLPLPEEEEPPPKRGFLSLFSRKSPVSLPVSRKAYPDDEFDIDDFWVFTDFWKSLGIIYPDSVDSHISVLRLDRDFMERLPSI